MKKQLLKFALLLFAAVMGGGNAIAETETVTVYSQDFNDENNYLEGWTINQRESVPKASRGLNSDNGYLKIDANNLGADRNSKLEFNYKSDLDSDNYTISFSFQIQPGNTNLTQQLALYTEKSSWSSVFAQATKTLLSLTSSEKYNSKKTTYSWNVEVAGETLDKTISFTNSVWYTCKAVMHDIKDSKGTLDITISDDSNTLIENSSSIDITEYGTLKGIFVNMAKAYSKAYFDNITVTKEIEAGTVLAPSYQLEGVKDTKRIFSLSSNTVDATILWSETAPSENETYASWNEYTENITTDKESIYAVCKKGEKFSEVLTIETGAGTTVSLNAATFSNIYYDSESKTYALKVNNDQSNVLLNPTATMKFYGDDSNNKLNIESGNYITRIPAGGTVYVEVSADGYTTAKNQYTVPEKREADGYLSVWNDDFTSGEALTNSGSFTLSNVQYELITKIGDTELSGNVGLYAYNTSRWSSTTNGLKDNGSYYFGTQNVSTEGYVKLIVDENSFTNNLLNGRSNIASSYAVKNEDGTFSIYYKPNGEQCSWNGLNGLIIKSFSYITPAITISLNSSYTYSTYCPESDLDFTNVEGVEVYKAQVSGDKVVTTKVEGKVKAGEGIIIKNVNKVESVTVPTTTDAEQLADNKLVGATEDISDWSDKNAYMLVYDNGTYKFQKIGTGTLKAGKAYLSVSAEAGAKPSVLLFGDNNATAISGVTEQADAHNAAIYNLQGMKVEKAVKGLYIINGKKYVK